MEEQYDTPSPEFMKGFNEGYTLAKYLSELSQQLNKAEVSGARGDGFQAGQKQVAVEWEQQRQPTWMQADFRQQAPDQPAADKQRDRDWDVDR